MSRESATKTKGLFVTFEGIEGCGKSTQLGRLVQRLAATDVEMLLTREPGGTALGLGLRALLLEPSPTPMAAEAELLLYAADRAQHLHEVVEPALRAGRTVLCDRYLDATLAYQGYGRGLGTERILELHRRAPLDRRPDRTVLLDLEPGPALKRARQRNQLLDLERTEGRFEMEQLEFHRRVRKGYLTLAAAEPKRIRVVDGAGTEAEVAGRVIGVLEDLFPALGGRP